MPIKTIQPFVSNFNAFAGEGFYGNVVQGLVIKQLEDAVFIFGIAIDGTLIFRKRNYPDVSTWEDPKIIIHSNNWHKIYFVTDLGELIGTVTANKDGLMSKNGFLERSKGNTLDFNDYTISGVWVFSDTGFINGPSVYRGGILLVFKTANGNILQICCDYTNSIFIRIHWGEWKSWARITTVVI